MPKESFTLNGFGGGLNLDASASDVISQGEGQDECVSTKNLSLDYRGKVVGETFTITTANPAGGVPDGTDHAVNNVAAGKGILVNDSDGDAVWHQQTGVYKVGENINYAGKNDFVVTKPTTGTLNPTNLTTQKDGVDISVIGDRGKDTLLFLGNSAANNPYGTGFIMDESFWDISATPRNMSSATYGPNDFIKGFSDSNANGKMGENVLHWTDNATEEYDITSTDPTTEDYSIKVKASDGSYIDLSGATGDKDVSKSDIIEFWHRDGDADLSPFIGFRVGDSDLNSGTDASEIVGFYGGSLPSPDGQDIILEFKMGANYTSSFGGIYIIYDEHGDDGIMHYKTGTLDSHAKMWLIDNPMIEEAGAHTDWARIVLPFETAFHTGSNFDIGSVRHVFIGFTVTTTATMTTGEPKLSIRELALTPSNKVYNWGLNDFRFSQTTIKNEVESIATVYEGTSVKNNNASTLTIQRPDSTHGPDGGNLYYESLDASGAPENDKFLLATWDKTKGVKKIGNDTYNEWSSTTVEDLVQNGVAFDGNWSVHADDADTSNGAGWTIGSGYALSDNDEHSSVINELGASMLAGKKYQLKFEITTAQLNLTIGGGTLGGSGNLPEETLIPADDYGIAEHTVEFTVGDTDRTHLWFYLDHDATGSGAGILDNVSLFVMPQVSLTFDDPPIGSTYTLESGYPDDTETINALFTTSAVVGRQVYIGNVAEEINHETIDTSSVNLNFQSPSAPKMRRASGSWITSGFTSATGYIVIQDATDAGNNVLHTAGVIDNSDLDWTVGSDFAGSTNETAKQVKITQFGAFDGSKILKGAVGKAAGFSNIEYIDLEFGGDTITVMESSGDRLLIFSNDYLTVVNVAQDIEFLEATMAGYGVAEHKSVCKVGEGVAWTNGNGVFFFDGQQVKSLSDEKMRNAGFGSRAIAYYPKDKLLIVYVDANIAYVYSFVSQTWVSHHPTLGSEPDTNSVPLGDGSATFFEDSGSAKSFGRTTTGTSVDMELKTGRMAMGDIAQNKKFHKVVIRGKKLVGIRLMYTTDRQSSATLIGSCTSNTTGTSIGEDVFKLTGVIGKWIQLTVEDTTTNGNALAEIEDISIIYRRKTLK